MTILSKKAQYLIAGGWNTIFGYFVMVELYQIFSTKIHIIVVAIIANFLSITMAFLTYKVFVFKTNGSWLSEYVKCYFVYGGMAALNVLLNWLCIEFLNMPIWLSQGFCILIGVATSYFSHSRFTFKNSLSKG
jgi:putative flippase GtrA